MNPARPPSPSPLPDASASPGLPPIFSAAPSNGYNVAELPTLLKGKTTTTHHHAFGKIQHPADDSFWSIHTTSCLLEAFQGKWNALRRKNLMCSQWEEVAAVLNMRCGLSTTAEQCRHKIEKLCKKYRKEKAVSDRFDAILGHESEDSAILSSDHVAAKTSCSDAVDHLEDIMPLWLKSRYFLDSQAKSNVNAPDLALAKIEFDDASFISSSQSDPAGFGAENEELGTTKVKVAGKISAKRRSESNILPALKSFMNGILRIEQHKMELQKDNERMRCKMELKRTEILVSSELKEAQMHLEMVKAADKSDSTKVKRTKTNLSE